MVRFWVLFYSSFKKKPSKYILFLWLGKTIKIIKRNIVPGSQRNAFLVSHPQALRLSPGFLRSYLNEMQHGEGEMLVTETAVHHHLNERQQWACQLSQSKHHLARGQKRSEPFCCHRLLLIRCFWLSLKSAQIYDHQHCLKTVWVCLRVNTSCANVHLSLGSHLHQIFKGKSPPPPLK